MIDDDLGPEITEEELAAILSGAFAKPNPGYDVEAYVREALEFLNSKPVPMLDPVPVSGPNGKHLGMARWSVEESQFVFHKA
jgi:hypothetical protein